MRADARSMNQISRGAVFKVSVMNQPSNSATLRMLKSLGWVVQGNEVAELITADSPLYVKFGLRKSRGLYPYRMHLEIEVVAIDREILRRAKISMEWLHCIGLALIPSKPCAVGLGIPTI